MKNLYAHYRNKYLDSSVKFDENSLDVYSKEGKHLVALRKNGAGQVVDISHELGLDEKHDLSELPEHSKRYVFCEAGNIKKCEKYAEKKEACAEFAEKHPHGKTHL